MGPLPRRLLAAAAAVVVLAAGGGYLFLASRDAPPAARLRPGGGAGGSGRPDGEWVVAPSTDGFVGYRVRERLGSISAPNDVVGRSPAVSGTVTIAGGAITGAEVTVDMTRLRTDVMAGWIADAGPLLQHVNLSAHHLLRNDLAASVAAALGDSGLPPECLALEITESVLMHDLEVAIVRLHELKALGVHLAIDDFGTGYSSLAYLRRFPIDALKIDKAFVDGVAGGAEESAVARAIIALAATSTWTRSPRAWSTPSRRPPWPSSAATWPRASTSPGRCRPPT